MRGKKKSLAFVFVVDVPAYQKHSSTLRTEAADSFKKGRSKGQEYLGASLASKDAMNLKHISFDDKSVIAILYKHMSLKNTCLKLSLI